MSAAIGLLGLVISFSVFIILMAQVWYDVSFDRSWPGSSRIYTFERPQDYLGDPNPFKALFNRPQIQTLREASPGVEAVGTLGETVLFDPQTDEPLSDIPAGLIDADFLRVFPFDIIAGTTDGFENPDALILTEKTARRLFGGASSAIGQQIMRFKNHQPYPATVIGVCREFPVNSTLSFLGAFCQIGDEYATKNDPNYESNEVFLLLIPKRRFLKHLGPLVHYQNTF